MSRFDNEIRVRPSVLDRLIDYEPEYSREAPASRVKNLRILKQSVRRDLEWLLNTRATAFVPPELKEVLSSIAVYGLLVFFWGGIVPALATWLIALVVPKSLAFVVALLVLMPYIFLFIATLHISDYVSYRDIFHADERPPAEPPPAPDAAA